MSHEKGLSNSKEEAERGENSHEEKSHRAARKIYLFAVGLRKSYTKFHFQLHISLLFSEKIVATRRAERSVRENSLKFLFSATQTVRLDFFPSRSS